MKLGETRPWKNFGVIKRQVDVEGSAYTEQETAYHVAVHTPRDLPSKRTRATLIFADLTTERTQCAPKDGGRSSEPKDGDMSMLGCGVSVNSDPYA